MLGRRRCSRTVQLIPWEASFCVLQDVIVERCVNDELWVVSRVPTSPGEVLTVAHLGSAPPLNVSARVTACEPVIVEGVLRHRLRLALEDGGIDEGRGTLRAVLLKVVSVRVCEVSPVGCLLETPAPLAEGTIGELQIDADGKFCWVRVVIVRSLSITEPARTVNRAAAEFFLSEPAVRDLLRATATPQRLDDQDSAGEKSSRDQTSMTSAATGEASSSVRVVQFERYASGEAPERWQGHCSSDGDSLMLHRDSSSDVPSHDGDERRQSMSEMLRRWIREDEGQDLIEYALLAGFISLAAVLAIIAVGSALNTRYGDIEAQVSAAGS